MKTEAKILICYNSPVSIFSIYNGKPAEENSDSKDLSEHSFASNMLGIENHLKTVFTDVKSLPIDKNVNRTIEEITACLLYTSPSPRDRTRSRMPSSA